MNAHNDDNGASLVPESSVNPAFPFGCAMIAGALLWALICAVIGWAVL